LPEASQELAREVESSPSVCLHVRRTDYALTSYHGVCSSDYYRDGVKLITDKVGPVRVFVFSDDLAWCRANIALAAEVRLVEQEHAGPQSEHHLNLMTRCKHFIISNSSFAWWAAWLSRATGKVVVAPRVWFAGPQDPMDDLIPKGWHRL
jgi:hypothetical protein